MSSTTVSDVPQQDLVVENEKAVFADKVLSEVTTEDRSLLAAPSASAEIVALFGDLELVDDNVRAAKGDGHTDTTEDDNNPLKQGGKHLEEKYGVKHEVSFDKNGKLVYTYYVDGGEGEPRILILTTDKPPEEADQELQQLHEKQTAELEAQFGIKISRDGDRDKNGNELRVPTFEELEAMRRSLFRTQPSQLTPEGNGVTILFHKDNDGPSQYKGGDQTIHIKNGRKGVKDITILLDHELAHNSQRTLIIIDRTYSGRSDAGMGWVRAGDQWALQAKNGDRYVRDNEHEQWIKVDNKGMPIKDESGNEIRLSNSEMRDQALVHPASDYFTNPVEMNAEGLVHFRGGEQTRRELLNSSPLMYELMRGFDQQEIDRIYGKNPDGSAKYMRAANGFVVENTPENRQALFVWEHNGGVGPK